MSRQPATRVHHDLPSTSDPPRSAAGSRRDHNIEYCPAEHTATTYSWNKQRTISHISNGYRTFPLGPFHPAKAITSICPIAIAYSMGQIIKSVCVCQSVCPSVGTLTVAFLDRFSPNWHRCKNHRPINIYPDAVPPIHAVSSHVATDKDPSK